MDLKLHPHRYIIKCLEEASQEISENNEKGYKRWELTIADKPQKRHQGHPEFLTLETISETIELSSSEYACAKQLSNRAGFKQVGRFLGRFVRDRVLTHVVSIQEAGEGYENILQFPSSEALRFSFREWERRINQSTDKAVIDFPIEAVARKDYRNI